MDKVTRTISIDLAKKVFHVAEMPEDGTVLKRRRLRRAGLQSYLAQLPRPDICLQLNLPAAPPTPPLQMRGGPYMGH